jgi:hypothetical protein
MLPSPPNGQLITNNVPQSPEPRNSPPSTRTPVAPSPSAVSPPTSPAGTPGTFPQESSPRPPTPNGTKHRTRRSTSSSSPLSSNPQACQVKPSSTQAATVLPVCARSGAIGATSTVLDLVFVPQATRDPALSIRSCGSSLVAKVTVLVTAQRLGTILSAASQTASSRVPRRVSGTRHTLRCSSRTLNRLCKIVAFLRSH